MSRKLVRSLMSLILALLVLCVPLFTFVAPAQAQTLETVAATRHADKRTVHIELDATSGVTTQNALFVGHTEAAQLNEILSDAGAFRLDSSKKQTAVNAFVSTALKYHYKVHYAHDVNVVTLVQRLGKLSVVESVYAQQKPAPAPASPSYRSLQTYLDPAPTGVNRLYSTTFPGGNGSKVKIVDIEYSWNTQHEDLTKIRTSLVPNGTPIDPHNNDNHGTAVAGALVADPNTFGTTGMTNGATVELINAYSAENGWDIPGALALAGTRTKPGDIILLEQQVYAPSGGSTDFAPAELLPDVYDAIVALTKSGRIVVEPAGSGNLNLDNPDNLGGRPDSGALMVGAGEVCATSGARSKEAWSNYGARVDVQGPGNCVAGTGYGNLYSAGGKNAFYTNTFNGTSSASAVVAGVAASFSSSYLALNSKAPSPLELRMLMIATGTAQNTSAGTRIGKVGPYPNLAKLLPAADKAAPGVPAAFKVALSTNKPNLTWTAPTDNVKVSGYQIYRDGVLYKTVTTTSFRDAAAVAGRRYSYKVRAFDDRPNYSAFTAQVAITSK